MSLFSLWGIFRQFLIKILPDNILSINIPSLVQPGLPSASDRRVWCHAITKLVQNSITDAWVKEAKKYVIPTCLAKHMETLDNHSQANGDH